MSLPVDPAAMAAISAWSGKLPRKCRGCNGTSLVAGVICELPVEASKGTLDVIPLICQQCGRTEFFSLAVIGGQRPIA